MEFFSSKFVIYLYSVFAILILLLGGSFFILRKRFGNILFLTQGEIELEEGKKVKILRVLPFMGEGYLIFVKLTTENGERFEVWGFSKSGGFKKISQF